MTRRLHPWLVVVLLVSAVAPLSAQRRRPTAPPPPPPAPVFDDIRVRSALTQTAAWVGDPLDFVIEIDAAPGIELVADDLRPEKLVVEGLELGPATSDVTSRADGWRTFRHRYRVTAFDTTPPKRIGDLVVRFRRPVTAATADGSAPAVELTVPGAVLAVRSTLPDDGSADGARDGQGGVAAPAWLAWLRPLGLGFIALGAAPVLLWAVTRIRRPRVARPRPSSRSLHARAKALVDELAICDTSTAEGRRRALDLMDAEVRAYVAQAEGVPATSLTADELRVRLASATRVNASEVCDILGACEHARYAPGDRLPPADAVGDLIGRVRGALGR